MVLQFKCNCIACKKNYPIAEHLKSADLRSTPIVVHGILNMSALAPMTAWAAYPDLIAFLQRNDRYSPCQEVATCQGLYSNVMTALYNKGMHLRFRVLPKDPITSWDDTDCNAVFDISLD